MANCIRCSSHQINPHLHGRDQTDLDLCDACYWRKRAEECARVAILAHDELLRGQDDAQILAILEQAWEKWS